jgi:hypothetical protein
VEDGNRWRLCAACEGTGGVWNGSTEDVEAARREVIKAFPESAVDRTPPRFVAPGITLHLSTGRVVDLLSESDDGESASRHVPIEVGDAAATESPLSTPSPEQPLAGLMANDTAARGSAAFHACELVVPPADSDQGLTTAIVQLFDDAWRRFSGDRWAAVKKLATTVLTDEGLLTIEIAAIALATEGEDGLTELLRLRFHRDFAIRSKVAIGVGSLGPRARWAAPALVRWLSRETMDLIQTDLVRALGRIGGRDAMAALRRMDASILPNMVRTALDDALGRSPTSDA